MNPEELWWGQVPGALRLKQAVQDAVLQEGRSVWIGGPVPWTGILCQAVEDYVSERDSRLRFTAHSGEELRGLSPEQLIFRMNPEAELRYMPGRPLAEYIQANQLLKTHVIWLCGLNQAEHEKWFAFSRDLAKLKTGLRVICQGETGNKRYQNVAMLYAKDYFSEFDRVLFAMLLAAKSGSSVDMRTYCSYLAAALAGDQAERIPDLLESPARLAADPEGTAAAAGIETGNWNKLVHSVQLKILLPALEDRQELLVDQLSGELKRLLPFTDEYGRVFQDLYSIELRNLYHLRNTKQLKMTPQQSDCLQRLYELRNLLAHRQVAPGEEVIRLIG